MTSDLVLSLDHLRDGLVTLVWRESDAVDTVRTVSFVQCVNVSTTTRPVSLSHVHDQGPSLGRELGPFQGYCYCTRRFPVSQRSNTVL
jgi:hypothetical protein